jgi:hypothetical protein
MSSVILGLNDFSTTMFLDIGATIWSVKMGCMGVNVGVGV